MKTVYTQQEHIEKLAIEITEDLILGGCLIREDNEDIEYRDFGLSNIYGYMSKSLVRLIKQVRRYGRAAANEEIKNNTEKYYLTSTSERKQEELAKKHDELSKKLDRFGLSVEFNGLYPSLLCTKLNKTYQIYF